MNIHRKFLKCECSSHALEVEYDEEYGQYSIATWHYGNFTRPFSFKEKIRWCWRILWTGNPWADSVILSKKTKLELIEFLKEKGESPEKEILFG